MNTKSSALSISRRHISHGNTRSIPQLARTGGVWASLVDSNSASRSFCVKFPVTVECDISRVHCSTFSTLLSGCDLKLMLVSPKKELSIILPDLNRVIYKSNAASNQYSFPFTKMVVPSQTIQFRVYSIMRDCQHIMFCDRFVLKLAFNYDNG